MELSNSRGVVKWRARDYDPSFVTQFIPDHVWGQRHPLFFFHLAISAQQRLYCHQNLHIPTDMNNMLLQKEIW